MAKKPAKGGHAGPVHKTKVVRHRRMSAAQYKAYLHYIKVHHLHSRPEKKKPKKPKKPVKAMAPALDGDWILAGNDRADTCVIAAVANSLLYTRNVRATDEQLARFDEGMTIEDAFEAVSSRGLAGMVLDEVIPYEGLIRPGSLIRVDAGEEPHAAMYLGGMYMASWGGQALIQGPVREAWELKWR
jgi:hypothetical protein